MNNKPSQEKGLRSWRDKLFLAQNGFKICVYESGVKQNTWKATTGPYSYVRHPQYGGFILIMLGFLFQWPTIPYSRDVSDSCLYMYVKLARKEEEEVLQEFGKE